MQDVFDMYAQASGPQKMFMFAVAATVQFAFYSLLSQLYTKLKHRPKE
jgi:hypothetical protein